MTAPVFRNLELLSSAPGGIQRLREVIWELAVRGLITGDEPDSWRRLSLGELGQWGSGGTPLKTHSEYYGGDIPWLVIGDLNDGLVTAAEQSITAVGLANSSAKLVPAGTVLIAMYGSIGKLGIAGLECATNQAIAHCQPNSSLVSSRYLFLLLRSMRSEFLSRGQGLAQQNISQKILKAVDVNLPPLEKQSRIVAKVDELMALCDRLEARQQDAEAAHARLVQALLDSLTEARDADEFQACWQQVAGLFPDLFTTAASVDSLRRTCIQLGLRGLICPPKEADGDAFQLLDAIQESKTRAWRAGVAPKPKAVSPIAPADQPYELPTGWHWVRLGQLGLAATGSTPPSSQVEAFGGPTPFIGPGQISVAGVISEGDKSLSDQGLALSTVAKPRDLLMVCIGGSIGKCAVADRALAFNQQINALTVLEASADYVHLVMRSPEFQQSVLSSATGSATPIINRSKWEELPVPLPPLAAQLRIVAKVSELFALCDQLKVRIAAARAKHAQLAEALMAQAVAA